MLDLLKERRADTRPRAGVSAAGFAAAVCLVFGLAAALTALSGAAASAADEAPVSRTPLADTGLWEPPVLNSTEHHQYLEIPADEGLAAFYGTYKPATTYAVERLERIALGENNLHYFGNTWRLIRDHMIDYKVLHQAENYVLVKYREFPIDHYDRPERFKNTGFGFFFFELTGYKDEFTLIFLSCDSKFMPLFAPDDYDQPPEQDIDDLTGGPVDEDMRRSFAEGKRPCGHYGAWFPLDRLING